MCGLFGKSRQSWYYKNQQLEKREFQTEVLLQLIAQERKQLPRIGGKKLFFLLEPIMKLHGIKMGRDKFFCFLREHNLLIHKKRKYTRTTNSYHRFYKYPNIIKQFIPTSQNQLYVSDITYIRLASDFAYLSLITDAFSKKIVGYKLHKTLSSSGCIEALQMALTYLPLNINEIIHHSDRGVQYCSNEYIEILKSNGFKISMTAKGDPYENAIAERINGILKDEFNLDRTFINYQEAKLFVEDAIIRYNYMRPHLSCNMLTPGEAHYTNEKLSRKW